MRDDTPVTPHADSWGAQRYTASWAWDPPDNPAGETARDVNDWSVATLRAALEDLGDLARVYRLEAWGGPGTTQHLDLRWDPAITSAEFLSGALALLQSAREPLINVDCELDQYVWVYVGDAEAPIRAWIRGGMRLGLFADPDGGAVELSLGHTLFVDRADNAVLYRANHPLLARALAALAARFGAAAEVEGLPGVFEGGFHPRSGDDVPTSWIQRLIAPPDDLRFHHDVGIAHSPTSRSGRHLLTLSPGGEAHLQRWQLDDHAAWTARFDPAILRRILQILADAGFPDIPRQPIYAGPSFRNVTVEVGGERTMVRLSRTIAEKNEPWKELCEWVDSLMLAIGDSPLPGYLHGREVAVSDVLQTD